MLGFTSCHFLSSLGCAMSNRINLICCCTTKGAKVIEPSLRHVYIGKIILAKMSATATDYVLALATLCDTTQIQMILSVSRHSMWPRLVQ
jgi:hypothetical protein